MPRVYRLEVDDIEPRRKGLSVHAGSVPEELTLGGNGRLVQEEVAALRKKAEDLERALDEINDD